MIYVVIGPPCSGKSTYVQEHRKTGDIVVDFDKLCQALGSNEKHAAPEAIKQVAFSARGAVILDVCTNNYDADSWIIHTKPTEKQMKLYEKAEAEYIYMDTDMETCLERCETDDRPPGTAEIIKQYFEALKGASFVGKRRTKMRKTRTFELKAENGTISGYAATFIREPDSWGDVIAPGAFAECLEKIKEEGKVLPLLWNHDSYSIGSYIGTVTDLEEDDHGLKFSATFDDTPEAQRARELAITGRVVKFSFAYDVLDAAAIKLEDGREVNELRKLNIHEVSLVMYPANPDTGIIDVKSAKTGRRNSKADEEVLREVSELLGTAQAKINSLMADDDKPDEEAKAKSEEQDPANDEEQKRIEGLIKEAEELLKKGE